MYKNILILGFLSTFLFANINCSSNPCGSGHEIDKRPIVYTWSVVGEMKGAIFCWDPKVDYSMPSVRHMRFKNLTPRETYQAFKNHLEANGWKMHSGSLDKDPIKLIMLKDMDQLGISISKKLEYGSAEVSYGFNP